jgi:hypothetical protein
MNTIVRIFLYVLLVIIISDLIYNVVSCIYSAAKDTKKIKDMKNQEEGQL